MSRRRGKCWGTALIALGLVGALAQAAVADCAPAPDARRIAVAGGSLTEIIYALGEAHRIIAVDRTSNFPREALDLPQIGYVRALSLEGVLSLAPTLVLGESDMGPPEVVDRLPRMGVTTVRVPESHDGEGILAKVRCVAAVLGVADQGEALIAERLATVTGQAAISADAPSGMVILRLQNAAPIAAGRGTSGEGLLRMAGANNVLEGFDGWKPISAEAMAAASPDFIVITESGLAAAGGLESLLQHPTIRLAPAARNGRVISMDGMAMLGFGLRTADAAGALRRLLAGEHDDG